MTDLVPWLLAQIEDDERAARTAQADATSTVTFDPEHPFADVSASDLLKWRFGPQRILAECGAKRSIIDAHPGESIVCPTCLDEGGSDWDERTRQYAPCLTLRLLALPFADRDGYRQEWKPSQ